MQLEDALGADQVLEAVLAERDKLGAVRQLIGRELGHGGGHQGLAAGGQGHDVRGAVDRVAEVVAFAQLGFAGVQAHAHPRRVGQAGPGGGREGVLAGWAAARRPRPGRRQRGGHHRWF